MIFVIDFLAEFFTLYFLMKRLFRSSIGLKPDATIGTVLTELLLFLIFQ